MKLEDKRLMPLKGLQSLNSFIKIDKGRFTQTETADSYCYIADPNPASDFYFKIKDVTVHERGEVIFSIVRKPYNTVTVAAMENGYDEQGLLGQYRNWVELVDTYEEELKGEVDPIVEGYQEEFFDSFELMDEDADTHSYPLPVQRILDTYFDKIILRLEEYKETQPLNEAKEAEIDAIIQEATQLRETQTQLTKRKVLEKLASLWAKTRKVSLKLLDEFKTELVKELIKKGVKELLDNPSEAIAKLNDFLINS